ncbi:hypothetical protein GOV04_00785 [Candidatus Woesearchaeota archaeon]|nr:hypothetical protein [Candidatus Woesearchaeota archaeon]
MQSIRGFIYFKDKTYDEVLTTFEDFQLDSVKLAFFKSLNHYGTKILQPGVFISGTVKKEHSSKDIVNIFRAQAGLEEKTEACDVSIESEDTIKELQQGPLKGHYTGLRILPPYTVEHIFELSKLISKTINAHNVLVRSVESELDEPSICIDLITKEEFEQNRTQVEKILSSAGLNIGKYIFLTLE